MDKLEGHTIRGYQFKQLLASGGFSEVYSAQNVASGKEVAIKRILPDKVEDGSYIERFRTEAEVVGQLNNPYIVPIYDHWRDDDGLYMVMKWMHKGNLRRRIDVGGSRDLAFVGQIVRQIGSALSATHQAGLIHRDLKPDNIMFDEDDNAYLADFGLAKNLNLNAQLTHVGWQLGSQAYSAPEQLSNSTDISPQSDIFAFGMVIFELLTGAHPFIDDEGDNFRWMVRAIREPMPRAHDFFPEIPTTIDTVLQKATEKAPEDRYADVNQMVEAFEQALDSALASPKLEVQESGTAQTEVKSSTDQPKGFLGRFFKKS